MSSIIIPSSEPILLREPEDATSLAPPSASDWELEKRCYATLWRHYPGAEWRVEVNSSTGMINVFCKELSSRWGYRIYIARAYVDPDLHCVMMAGGDLLERANRSRGRWDEEHPVGYVEGIRPQDQPLHGLPI